MFWGFLLNLGIKSSYCLKTWCKIYSYIKKTCILFTLTKLTKKK